MNHIFRKNKENINLDLLEESDDEDEFQNISYDKNVNTEKIVLMNVEYYGEVAYQLLKIIIKKMLDFLQLNTTYCV
jgi:hypothetical protein